MKPVPSFRQEKQAVRPRRKLQRQWVRPWRPWLPPWLCTQPLLVGAGTCPPQPISPQDQTCPPNGPERLALEVAGSPSLAPSLC